jgi:glycosyltransferase involved in cell wall biosynthesis
MGVDMDPLVSVIIPAYNMADYTGQTVSSLLEQTYPHVEIIVVDDGSTDDTGREMCKYGDKITYIYQENMGACVARNRGFHASKGNLVAFLDCDDYYHTEKIEKYVEIFRSFPNVGMVYSPEYLVDGEERIIGINGPAYSASGYIFLPLLRNNFIGSSTPIIRREVLDDVGLWDEEIFTTADWDMWLRISREYLTGYVNQPLSFSRQESLYNQNNVEKTRQEAYYVLEKLRMVMVPEKLLRESKSNIDILLHRYTFNNGNYRDSLEHLFSALRARPFQMRAYILLVIATILKPLSGVIFKWKESRRIRKWNEALSVDECGNVRYG